ncbi:MAG: pyridoxamine 5'-phosphate oxidase family protein [archaeon]|nr:pyridoxamine 5'-phosphate oxidase family protein [archaeon]
MRRKEKEIEDQDKIELILKKSMIGRIGLSQSDVPYIVPVNYIYDNGTIYVHSAKEGKKIEILKNNNNVCFEVDILGDLKTNEIACKFTQEYQSVMGFGKAYILTDKEKKIEKLNLIMKKYSTESKSKWEYNDKIIENILIIEIIFDKITGKQSGK